MPHYYYTRQSKSHLNSNDIYDSTWHMRSGRPKREFYPWRKVGPATIVGPAALCSGYKMKYFQNYTTNLNKIFTQFEVYYILQNTKIKIFTVTYKLLPGVKIFGNLVNQASQL